jgi:hypothetical protein
VHQLPDVQKKAEDEDNDRRPRWESTPPTAKREWKASIALMKKKANALAEDDASAPFRVSQFPSCLLHAEADLRPKKAFKEASLRTNVAGACGLALIRSGELAFSALGKNSSVMSRLNAAISGDSTQDVEMLLQVLRDTREDLTDVAVGLKGIAHVGSSIAAGSFNQGIEDVRHLVWELTAAKSIRPTLELCPPSLTHLFGDDVRVKEALEAERRRPYQAAPYRSRPYANQMLQSTGAKALAEEEIELLQEVEGWFPLQALGKSEQPCLQEGGGPEEEVSPSREAGEVVLGLVSPAQMPCPATTPFRSAPGPRPSGGRGQTAPLPPILKGRIGDVPSSSPGRGRLPSPLHVLTASCIPGSSLLHSFARGERPPD